MNGLVTTPTVRIPISFEILAITGAAPVPVPPPRPQATKIMSAPEIADLINSSDSIAAFLPTSGFPPAPKPFVNFSPNKILFLIGLEFKACASVFATYNSTPAIPSVCILLTEFPPAPPTPITFIFAAFVNSTVFTIFL